MIADYKFFHGAVLSELVDSLSCPLTVSEFSDAGRLSAYILNKSVGLQIKHCTNRLRPWNFAITTANLKEILELRRACKYVFLVLVCHDDGMVSIRLDELLEIILPGASGQAWVRVDRRKNKLYSVCGGAAELRTKRPNGVHIIVEVLDALL